MNKAPERLIHDCQMDSGCIMTDKTKYMLLLLLALAMVGAVLLASSLADLRLQPGTPIPGAASEGKNPNTGQIAPGSAGLSLAIAQGILALGFALGLLYLAFNLIIQADWKKIARLAAWLVALFALAGLLPRITPARPEAALNEPLNQIGYTSFEYITTPLGKPPQELVWVVLGGLALLVSFLAIYSLRATLRQRAQLNAQDAVRKEAEDALAAYRSGVDFKDVILRCYHQMSQALQEEQGLERGQAMTAREFERLLEGRGVPAVPVRQLTRLFEAVRYGNWQPTAQDQQTGLDCLTAISQYCRKRSEPGQ